MFDMTDQYNTELGPEEEAAFQQWAAQNNRSGDTYDYDLRGLYKDTKGAPLGAEHSTDKYKKPNHPTFSNESQYHGKDGAEGGKWEQQKDGSFKFFPGRTNMEMYGPLNLQEYFQKSEPGNQVVLPEGE